MKKPTKKIIDWQKTGKNLQLLRNDNIELRRFVCSTLYEGKRECVHPCDECKYEMDSNVSRAELAKAFNVSESVIYNWENGKTPVALEDIMFYCEVAKVALSEIIVSE